MYSRFIINKYNIKEINFDEIYGLTKEHLAKAIDERLQSYPPECDYAINSKGRKKTIWEVYTGSGGNIYTFWRYYLFKRDEASLKYFSDSYNVNFNLIHEKNDNPTAFFMGSVGIYTLGCMLAKETNDENLFFKNLELILNYKDLAISSMSEDELLYGNAGYLYSLLLINNECRDKFQFDIIKVIYDVVMFLYGIGKQQRRVQKTSFLIYPFPRLDKKTSLYLGGAHGVIGVLYMILNALYLLPQVFEKEIEFIGDIRTSIDEISKLQFESGNFPSSISKLEKDELVHFCHGAIGAVYLYGLAYTVFKDEIYMKVMIKCGQTIWERGLLKKGNGICHGIAGNAYALHKIYTITNDIEWKNKMLYFVYATFDPEIQVVISKYEDPQRYKIGKPDTPYSLMEGNGGIIVLYSDLLNEDKYVKFPGYDIIN
jgi:lantibiotic modifying enzyme